VSGRSSWCFTEDHAGCRYASCSCACHRLPAQTPHREAPLLEGDGPAPGAAGPAGALGVAAVPPPARPVPAGLQAELGFPDSIDGSTDDVVTVVLSLRGQGYEVDLSRQHRDDLQAALAPFIAVARPGAGPHAPERAGCARAVSAPH